MLHRFALVALSALAMMPFSAWALDANVATYQPVTRTDLVKLPPQAQANPVINQNTAGTLTNAAINGNLQQTGTRLATNAAGREAANQLATGTGLSRNAAGTLTNAAINGNLQQTGTRLATNAARNEAVTGIANGTGLSRGVSSDIVRGVASGNIQQTGTRIAVREGSNAASRELAGAAGISSGDSRAIVNGVRNGNIQQVGTRIAVREGSNALTQATGLPRGLTGGLLGGALGGGKALFGGRGGEASSARFVQKNDYIAETDDGIIRHSADGKLSSALNNLGFGNATALSLSPEGIIRNATGQVTGRLDRQTGQLFNAAGNAIPSNSLVAQRMMENISQGTTAQPSATSLSRAASGIPASFGNSNWDAATRQKEWASLPPTQQANWIREATVKASTTTGGYSIPTGSNQILDANGTIVGRLSPSATSQFADAAGQPISPNSPQYNTFKQLLAGR